MIAPHLTGALDDGKHPSELAILQSGTYNLGFIALRNSEESRRFVAWWQGKLLRDCVVDIPRGLFTDQKWIDLVPGMYGDVTIERDSGWNVAYWNLAHRNIVASGDGHHVNGRPLLFFHFSGFVPGARLLSKHQDRFTLENVSPAMRALADEYAADLQRAGAEECARIPYAFGRFPGGEPISDLVRRCYRQDFPWDAPHPDLWTLEGQAFLIDWLNRPGPGHRHTPWFTHIAATLYWMRLDLQAAFPDVTGAHGPGYAHWFVENAKTQAGFDEIFVAPVRAALPGARKPKNGVSRPESGADANARIDGQGVEALPDGLPAPVKDPTSSAASGAQRGLARSLFQGFYRAAWGLRHAVKPLTTQAFRHRIRHTLLRKAYFDASYKIPPLTPVPAGASGMLTARTGGSTSSGHGSGFSSGAGGARARVDVTGLNVVGYLAAESGVGESARSTLRILDAARISVAPIDFRVGNLARMNEIVSRAATGRAPHSINLFHINADQMQVAWSSLGSALFEGRYNIGYWAWELPEFPDIWVPAFDLLDKVWVPSAFCQQAIAAKSPVPVLRVPHSVDPGSAQPDRSAFGIGGDVAFLAMCDVLSVPERKNPVGVIEAFRRAFPANEPVRLFLKITNLEYQPDLKEAIDRFVADDPRIKLLDGYLTRAQLWTLMASIDCYVSLHRSEGFGLGMAEAMACGRAVIATDWSGNIDFTRPENALLVDYQLIELERDLGPYRRGQVWAEPDIDGAADCMRRIAASPELRQHVGRRAAQTIAREISPAAIAPIVKTRLDAIAKRR